MTNRNNTRKKPLCPHHKNKQYKEKLTDLNSLDFYMNISEKYNKFEKLVTKREIYYVEPVKFGSSIETTKNIMEVPTHSLSNRKLKSKILLYKIMIGHYRVNLKMLFHLNQLVLYCLAFSYLRDGDHHNILETLKNKYLEQDTDIDFSKQSIIDDLGHCILVDDMTTLKITYFSYDTPFFEEINSLVQAKKSKDAQKNRTRYNRLYQAL